MALELYAKAEKISRETTPPAQEFVDRAFKFPVDSQVQFDEPVVSDGGPSGYYDFAPRSVTLNDELERKGDEQWLGDTFHVANVVKAAWRWGRKGGTSKEYDARKFIYSGCRLLMKYAGKQEVRNTLQRLLDDKQFQND